MKNTLLDFIFGLSSLLALVITVVYTAYSYSNYGTLNFAPIIALSIANIVLIIITVWTVQKYYSVSKKTLSLQPRIDLLEKQLTYSKNRLSTTLDNYSEISDILHSINDQLRNKIFELLEINIDTTDDISKYQRKNEMFYLFLLDNIKNIFDILTRDKCSVSLKLLDEDEELGIIVRTFLRDSSSYRERKNNDNLLYGYPYYENTAFKNILSEEHGSYFVSDDLSKESTYINLNQNWNDYYNATLVCPIRVELPPNSNEEEGEEYSIPGFICIDNVKGNLNNKTCINILASIADILFIHWYIYDDVKYELEQKKIKEETK